MDEYLSDLILDGTVVVMHYEPHLSAVSLLTNLFHLSVLSHKSMRTSSSTNVILLGIVVCELYSMAFPIAMKIADFLNPCYAPPSYPSEVGYFLSTGVRDDVRRCVTFLSLSMAVLRVYVIRKPEKSAEKSEAKFGWQVNLVIAVFSSIISVFYMLRNSIHESEDPWEPFGEECIAMYPPNYTQPDYWTSLSELSMWNDQLYSRVFLAVEGTLSSIMPSILLPILTVQLVVQLRKVAQTRGRLFSDKQADNSQRTTRLVTYMSVSFIITNMPSGLAYVGQAFCWTDDCLITFTYLEISLTMLLALNSLTHFPICFHISTQYRNTLKTMLRMETRTAGVVSGNEATRTISHNAADN